MRALSADCLAPPRPVICRQHANNNKLSRKLMPRIGFGAFLAPHHPIGEHPMLQFRRDLDFAEHLDKLGYDEFWCGEHHSSRLGDDRFAGNVPGRCRRAHQAHQARHRRRVAALSPPLQRRAAHGAARPHDRRPRDLRLRPRRAAVGRLHARHRPDGAARPPGRGDRRHQAADGRRARHRRERMVHAARCGAADPAAAGGDAVRDGLADLARRA